MESANIRIDCTGILIFFTKYFFLPANETQHFFFFPNASENPDQRQMYNNVSGNAGNIHLVVSLLLTLKICHHILNKFSDTAEVEPRVLFLIFTALHLATEQ